MLAESSFTVILSVNELGTSFVELTLTVTVVVEVSPLASVIVYVKESEPLKLANGVYVILSSNGFVGVALLSTETVPFSVEDAEVIEIVLELAPSPPKESLAKTSKELLVESSSTDLVSATAVGVSFTEFIVIVVSAVEVSPFLSVIV